jgi:hypothetical protein
MRYSENFDDAELDSLWVAMESISYCLDHEAVTERAIAQSHLSWLRERFMARLHELREGK